MSRDAHPRGVAIGPERAGRTRRSKRLHGIMDRTMSSDPTTIDRPGIAERERVLALLREKEAELRALGVTRLRLFGSMARGEAGPESDVDLMAQIDRSLRFSLLDLVGLQFDLGNLIGRRVEIATGVEKMRPRIRRRFEADAIEVL